MRNKSIIYFLIINLICILFFGYSLSKNLLEDDDKLFNYAQQLENEENYEKASLVYQQIILKYPKSKWGIKSQFNLACCYFKIKNFDKAGEEIRKYIILYPNSKQIHWAEFMLGSCYEKQGKYSKAIRQYQYLITKYPQTKVARVAQQAIEVINLSNTLDGKIALIWTKFFLYSSSAAFLIFISGYSFISILLLCLILLIQRKKSFESLAIIDSKSVKWSSKEVITSYILFSVIVISINLIFSLIFYGKHYYIFMFESSPFILITTQLIASTCLFLLIWRCLKRHKLAMKGLGFSHHGIRKNISKGIMGVCGMYLLWIGYSIIYHYYRGFQIPLSTISDIPISTSNIFLRGYIFIVIGIIIPIVEEIFHRGFLYPILRKNMGVGIGICMSSLFFAIVHFSISLFIWHVISGLIYTILYERTKSLIPSTTAHILHNTLLYYINF